MNFVYRGRNFETDTIQLRHDDSHIRQHGVLEMNLGSHYVVLGHYGTIDAAGNVKDMDALQRAIDKQIGE